MDGIRGKGGENVGSQRVPSPDFRGARGIVPGKTKRCELYCQPAQPVQNESRRQQRFLRPIPACPIEPLVLRDLGANSMAWTKRSLALSICPD